MKKSIKLWAVLFALVSLCLVFTGCDNGSSSPEYRVSFDLNWYGKAAEGMGEVEAPKPVWFKAVGQSITLPQVLDGEGNIYFTENGYYVDNWYKDMNLTQSAGSAFTGEEQFTPEGSCTLYARWSTRTVTLDWDLNYPTGVSVPLEELKKFPRTRPSAGTAVATPADTPAPIPEGEFKDTEFVGWFDSPVNGEGNQITGETRVPVDGGTYYAQWKYPVKVTYLLPDGKEYTTVTQKAYDAVELPAENPDSGDSSKPFGGWYDAEGNTVTTDRIIRGGEVFYAQWGIGVILKGGAEDVKVGATVGKTSLNLFKVPEKAGYAVMSYFTDETYAKRVAYADGTLVAGIDGITDGDGKWIATSSQTFYAKFGKKVGGLIYFVDSTGYDKNKYTFYDADGNKLNAIEKAIKGTGDADFVSFDLAGVAAQAVYYEVEGTVTKDRYYVVNDTLDKSKTYTWTYYKNATEYAQDSTTVLPTSQGIGTGKANTEKIMAKDDGAYVSNAYGKTTIWYALEDLNNGTYGGKIAGDTSSNLGCTDWFVPSVKELINMTRLVNDKAWTFDGGPGSAPYVSDPAWAKIKTYVAAGSEWSSSGCSATDAYLWISGSGAITNNTKNITYRLVAVRAF